MGNVLWIKEAHQPGGENTIDLWALYHFMEPIDQICRDAGVKELSAFHDNSEIAAEFGQNVQPMISDATELLRTLEAISQAVSAGSHDFMAHGEDRGNDLVKDLAEAIRVASGCKDREKQIQLTVVM